MTWTSSLALSNATDQTVTLRLRATDVGSGVAAVGATLRSPDSTVPLLQMTTARRVTGNDNDGVWELSGKLPKSSASGTWQLVNLAATDRVGLTTRYTIAASGAASAPAPSGVVRQPTFRLTASGYDVLTDDCPSGPWFSSCAIRGSIGDRTLPVANLSTARWAEATTISNDRAQTVTLSIRLGDDLSGVADAVAYLSGPGGASIRLTGVNESNPTWWRSSIWTISGILPAAAAPGQWRLDSLQFTDGVGHLQVVTLRPDGSCVSTDGRPMNGPATIRPLTVTAPSARR